MDVKYKAQTLLGCNFGGKTPKYVSHIWFRWLFSIQQVLNICTSISPRYSQCKQGAMRLMAGYLYLESISSLRVMNASDFRAHLHAEIQSRVPAAVVILIFATVFTVRLKKNIHNIGLCVQNMIWQTAYGTHLGIVTPIRSVSVLWNLEQTNKTCLRTDL